MTKFTKSDKIKLKKGKENAMNKTVLEILRYLFTIGIPSVLVLIAVIALLKVYVLPAFFTSRKKQESRQVATVLKKREEVLSSNSGIYSLYLITFKLDNDSVELRVPKSTYDSYESGDKGELTSVGDRFVDFTVTEKAKAVTENEVVLAGDTMRSALNIIEQKERK